MRQVIVAVLAWAFIIFVSATYYKAYSHSWYDPWCCNNTDCAPLKPEEITVNDKGYTIKGEFFIPHGDERIRLSRDWDYHFCEYPKGEARCFYVPPGGS
jgi:hypothetical protein